MRLLRLAFAALVPALAAAPCCAAANGGADPLDVLFLDAGARPAALGGAYSALASDSNALLYNPAGLGRVRRYEATLMHDQYFQGVNHEYLGAATKQGLGFSLNYVGYGQITRTTISQPNSTLGTFGASDVIFGLGYGRELYDTLSLGLGLKLARENIDNVTASAYAADVGALLPIPRVPRLVLGASLQNIGPSVKYLNRREALPMSLRAGLSYGFTYGETENTLTADMLETHTGDSLFAGGAETVIYKMMAARLGFNMRNDAGLGITAGLGWTMSDFSIDYAIVPYGELGLTHRVSATVRWGAGPAEEYRPNWSSVPRKSAQAEPSAKSDDGAKRPPKAGKPASTSPSEKWDADSPEAHFARAEEHRKAGYFSLALKELKAAQDLLGEKDQRMVYYHEQVGYISWLKGDVYDAKMNYLDGLKLAMELGLREPVVADAYAGLGMCLVKQDDPAYALKIFRKALELNPSPKTRGFVEKEIQRLGSIDESKVSGGSGPAAGAGAEIRESRQR